MTITRVNNKITYKPENLSEVLWLQKHDEEVNLWFELKIKLLNIKKTTLKEMTQELTDIYYAYNNKGENQLLALASPEKQLKEKIKKVLE